jgi:hypothetical protein
MGRKGPLTPEGGIKKTTNSRNVFEIIREFVAEKNRQSKIVNR